MWKYNSAKRKGTILSDALWSELEKIDVLRERMGVGYEEARTALNLAQGDLLKALDNLEKAQDGKGVECDWIDRGQGIWDDVKQRMIDFNHTKVSLKKHNNTILSVSAPLGLALAYTIWRRPGLRILALAGAVGAAMNQYEIEVAAKDKPKYNKSKYNDEAFNFTTDGEF